MISWGIALLCHVPVTNKGGIYATCFLLGAVSVVPVGPVALILLTMPSSKRECFQASYCR